ncbi:hypothetical protein U9M48_040906 [Paspalum notatum var. saurae]|uniref:Uncharacterized protein n=1 Tax=Paspalum notatum var. saurae TaxID=547442 RepID=A0AAQ3US30_PASNO
MKRPRTLRSFFSPAITPVILAPSQENVNINLQQPVETGASIDAHASADASVDASIVDTPIFDAPAAIDVDAPIETPATASNEEVEFNSSKIIVDPGLQKPIEEFYSGTGTIDE